MKKLCPSISGERNLAAQCNPSLALGVRGEQEFSAVAVEYLRRSGFSRDKTQSATPRLRLKALLRRPNRQLRAVPIARGGAALAAIGH